MYGAEYLPPQPLPFPLPSLYTQNETMGRWLAPDDDGNEDNNDAANEFYCEWNWIQLWKIECDVSVDCDGSRGKVIGRGRDRHKAEVEAEAEAALLAKRNNCATYQRQLVWLLSHPSMSPAYFGKNAPKKQKDVYSKCYETFS